MVEDDVQLIHRVLSGDDEAFTTLIRKHQKSVHALAWRRVDDFHFAEEITQDVFLRVYKHLSKLKNPNQFSGWLYVVTNRLCNTWLKKNKSVMQPLEDIPVVDIERSSYSGYVSEQREEEVNEQCRELVRKLLKKLPESERTVMTLYYLGEMTTKEIGKFLGVSMNTITSRLHRARKRLQEEEEILVQEVLEGVQLSNNFTENIAQKVVDVKLTRPVNWKPFVPWASFGVAVLVMLLLTASSQYLIRFQQPYSFEAESERTVEIIDAPVVLNSDAKPAVRNQAGRAAATAKDGGDGVQISDSVLVSKAQDALVRSSVSRWTQTSGPRGGPVFDIFATSEGVLYTFSPMGTYRLAANATMWVPVAVDMPTEALRVPMVEHAGVLYLVSDDTVFTSTDDGETWNAFCSRPEGYATGLVITGALQQVDRTMYLALKNKGVFRSTNAGERWMLLNDGLMGRTVPTMAAIGDTVFAGTDSGLYHLDEGVWKRLLVDVSGSIYSLVVAEDSLYVCTGPDFRTLPQIRSKQEKIVQAVYDNNLSLNKVFHSSDLGTSWTEITPMDGSHPIAPTGISLLVTDKTILAQTDTLFRSKDGGQTWINLGFDLDSLLQNTFLSVAVSENTFYKAGMSGIYRTTDGGESWHLFMDGIVGTGILDLVAVNNKLYVHTDGDILQSMDRGESWETVGIDVSKVNPKPFQEGDSRLNFSGHSRLTIAGNTLYVVTPEKDDFHFLRLSTDSNALVPIQGVPAFEVDVPFVNSVMSEGAETGDNIEDTLWRRADEIIGGVVVSGETFYTEYQRKLFKWESGDSGWRDTGLMDTGEQPEGDLKCGFRLAVSGETVYVGKRNGRLFQSLDAGSSWKDITPNLPLRFTCFKEIIFAGSTVYVATDAGVLASQSGVHWRVIKDNIIIDRFAVNGVTVYGVGDKGVYRLDVHGDWKQISPGVPGKVRSLVVDRDRLYVATEQRGMFHISLEEDNYLVNH